MNELPRGWVWATFDDVAVVESNLVDPAQYQQFAHVAPNHIESRTGRLRPHSTIRDDRVTSAKHLFAPGRILYSKIRPYLAKAAFVQFPGLCSADMYPVSTSLVPQFLHRWLISPEFTALAAGQQGRSVLPKINQEALRRLPVPVPPRREQEQIVAAIEELLSRVEATVAALENAGRRLASLEKSIITASASTTKPPDHWRTVAVGDTGTVALGLQRSPKRHTGPNMRPYLRVANVFEDRIDDSDVMTMDMTDAEWERFRLRDGDVLLNEGQTPELLGRPAIYRGKPADVAFTNSLIRFRPNDDVDPEWALLVFRSHLHNRRFMRESQITTNIAHLAAGRFKTVEFPIPPMEEQRRRIDSARAALSVCARLRCQITTLEQRATAFRRSVLAAAFSGKLVPQNPDDEPASVLLDRIRAERAAAQPGRRRRRAGTAGP